MSHLAWRSQPPEQPAEDLAEGGEADAEVVDLTKQRLLGWLRGMFGGEKQPPPDES